jgi:hypothetical protein
MDGFLRRYAQIWLGILMFSTPIMAFLGGISDGIHGALSAVLVLLLVVLVGHIGAIWFGIAIMLMNGTMPPPKGRDD